MQRLGYIAILQGQHSIRMTDRRRLGIAPDPLACDIKRPGRDAREQLDDQRGQVGPRAPMRVLVPLPRLTRPFRDHGDQDAILRSKIVEHRRRRDAAGLGNLGHRGRVDALGGEQVLRRSDDLIPPPRLLAVAQAGLGVFCQVVHHLPAFKICLYIFFY